MRFLQPRPRTICIGAFIPTALNPLGMIIPIGKYTMSFCLPRRAHASTVTSYTIFDIECAKGAL